MGFRTGQNTKIHLVDESLYFAPVAGIRLNGLDEYPESNQIDRPKKHANYSRIAPPFGNLKQESDPVSRIDMVIQNTEIPTVDLEQ